MPGPFDTTTRYLVEAYPADWLAFLGFDVDGTVEVVDTHLSAVSAEVDKVLRITRTSSGHLVHVEFQSSYDPTIGARILRYNTMLHLEPLVPVASVLVLSRPSADGQAARGRYQITVPGNPPYLTFDYGVRRVWQEPPREFLDGPLGTLPLAPLGATEPSALPGLLRDMDQRFTRETTNAQADRLRVVTYTLLGLRYQPDTAALLMPGMQNMRDSSTYMAIVEEGLVKGRVEGERRLLLLFGESRFGPADDAIRSQLDAITDAAVIEQLARRLLTVASWTELFAEQV